jgi:TRAP-type C4-dicarboxylate transport system permease large subunit
MIFYGAIIQTSVGGLFMGGIVPGLLLGGGLMAGNAYFAHRHNHPGGKGEPMPKLTPSFLRAAPALMLPLIILSGIVFGVVTPTEAGALAAILAASLGFVYEGMDLHKLRESFRETAILSGSIFMVLTAAACAGWLASLEQIPQGVGLLVNELGLTGCATFSLSTLSSWQPGWSWTYRWPWPCWFRFSAPPPSPRGSIRFILFVTDADADCRPVRHSFRRSGR